MAPLTALSSLTTLTSSIITQADTTFGGTVSNLATLTTDNWRIDYCKR